MGPAANSDVTYKDAPLQQGVTVKVVPSTEIRGLWAAFKRDDYEPDMDKVGGKQGVVLHQHPSGAFTVLFDGKASGLKKGESYRFKFPPKALVAMDKIPVKKRKPRLPKHVKEAPPTTPQAPPPLVEPVVVNEPPPECSVEQRLLDNCLQPSPRLTDKEDQKKSVEEARRLAIMEDEIKQEVEEEALVNTPEPAQEPEPAEEEEDDDLEDEEAAYLQRLQEEEEAAAAEEAAFLAELQKEEEIAAEGEEDMSPRTTSTEQQEAEYLAQLEATEDLSDELSVVRDNRPRTQVVYEPHDSVRESALRFREGRLKDKTAVQAEHLVKPQNSSSNYVLESSSPRRQVINEDRQRVGDLRERFNTT